MPAVDALRHHAAPRRPAPRPLVLALLFPLLATSTLAQSATQTSASPAQQTTTASRRSPHDWARQVADHEIANILNRDLYLRYRVHVLDAHGDRTRDVIEAREGTVSRTILRDGRPLAADENQAERDRLTGMLNSPAAFNRHVKSDIEGKKLAVDLITLMPDAMVYTFTSGQPPLPASANQRPATSPVVLDFQPDPTWKPPTTTAEALTGLKGRMWIDPSTAQILRMEGTIFQGVNLGWGMLAHIYPGGKVVLEQTPVSNSRWIYTHFTEEATVRAVMIKTINVHTTIDAGSFQSLPAPLTYQDAIRALLNEPTPTP